jgi:hypothetical protein
VVRRRSVGAVLREVRALYRAGRRWVKGDFVHYEVDLDDQILEETRCFCLAGGVARCSAGNSHSECPDSTVADDAIGRLHDVIMADPVWAARARGVTSICQSSALDEVTCWNDHEATTIEDVRAVLRKAVQS